MRSLKYQLVRWRIFYQASARPQRASLYQREQVLPLALCQEMMSSSSYFRESTCFWRIARFQSCCLPRLINSSSISPLAWFYTALSLDAFWLVLTFFFSNLLLLTLIGLQTATRSLYFFLCQSALPLTAWLFSSISKYLCLSLLRLALVVLSPLSRSLILCLDWSISCCRVYRLDALSLSSQQWSAHSARSSLQRSIYERQQPMRASTCCWPVSAIFMSYYMADISPNDMLLSNYGCDYGYIT